MTTFKPPFLLFVTITLSTHKANQKKLNGVVIEINNQLLTDW